MSSVIDEVSAERQRQIEKEGWTPAHDDKHAGGELARAASCYARYADLSDPFAQPTNVPDEWPFDGPWWKPKNERYDLIRAAALIVAEIERLDREQQNEVKT